MYFIVNFVVIAYRGRVELYGLKINPRDLRVN